MTTKLQLLMLGAVLIIALIAVIPQWRESKRRLGAIWSRACTGREWRRQFPNASKEDIRKFLTLLTESFGFETAHRLKFKPSDTVIGIYQARYPQEGWADALEMETFAVRIEEAYGCTVTEEWKFSELTLAQIFEKTRSPNTPSQTSLASSAV
jgi:hypothetical protein